ncbi:hypothetical protein AB2M62_08200 [Sphingomonas sp. MMS12-HWE2-04]|uniref:hypothetical protein n=1 Tax=Sphingomonas sp. MMS12-HWE2-04 TaxID=3234199 RepID=UPI00384F108C
MVRFVWEQLVELYRRGFALFVLAPVIVALVVVPEFLQHIVEIRLGMFESIARGHGLANDPKRWAFGYAKLTGLLLAMLASARFWNAREQGGRWWDLRDIAWLRLAIALALFIGISASADLLRSHVAEWLFQAVNLTLSLVTLPLMLLILAALFGDHAGTLTAGYWRGWRWLPLFVLLLVAAYGPAMALHYGLHRLAIGQPEPLVWALMTLDALTVGLLASLTGAAFSLAYRAWRLPR